MTQKQFEFIMKSLKAELLSALHSKEIWCDLDPSHSSPDWRYRAVVDAADIDRVINLAFSEVMEDEDDEQ